MSSDLLDDLTIIQGDGYGVSALSKDLIRAVGLDVIQFRRNQQVAYRVVERSRDVLNKINGLISKIETAQPTGDEHDWDDFDLYQGGIDSLEELLFGLSDIAGDEAERYLFTLNDVVTCIGDVETWAENRKKLREAASKLLSDKPVVDVAGSDTALEEEFAVAELQDDLAFYNDLVRNIKGHDILKTKRLGEVRDILHNLEQVLSGTDLDALNKTNKSFVTIAVKFAFMTHGAMEIAVKPETDADWKLHLKSKLVWDAAHGLALHIADGNETYGDYATLQAHYDEFIKLLQSIPGVEAPKSYLELMKLAGRIRRPYGSRALALVILCRALVNLFNSNGNRLAKNVEPLEDVFEQTIGALNQAIEAYQDLKLYDLNSYDKDEVIEAFNTVQDSIKKCYSMLGADAQWTNEASKKLAEAEKKDRERVELMNARLSPTSPKLGVVGKSDEVSVEVTVKDRDGNPLGDPVTVKVKPSARLAAVRFYVARSQPGADAGHFEDANGLTITMDKSVQEVKGDATDCKLVLSLAPSVSDAESTLSLSQSGSEPSSPS